MNYSSMQVTNLGVDTMHLELNAENHPDMPIEGYRVEYKEEGEDWSMAQIADFEKGLSLTFEEMLTKILEI